MKLDVDTKQRIMTWTYMMMEIYKVLMGTFLVIFVPFKSAVIEFAVLLIIFSTAL